MKPGQNAGNIIALFVLKQFIENLFTHYTGCVMGVQFESKIETHIIHVIMLVKVSLGRFCLSNMACSYFSFTSVNFDFLPT